MPRDEYWNQDPYIVEEYLGAYRLQMQEKNWFAWLNDIYTFDAVSAVIANVHFDKGSHKFVEPMKEPIQILPDTPEEAEAKRQKQLDLFVARLNQFHENFSARENSDAGHG